MHKKNNNTTSTQQQNNHIYVTTTSGTMRIQPCYARMRSAPTFKLGVPIYGTIDQIDLFLVMVDHSNLIHRAICPMSTET